MSGWLKKIILGQRYRPAKRLWTGGLGLACLGLVLLTQLTPGLAQSEDTVEKQEDAVIQQYALPKPAPKAPVVQPSPPRPAAPAPAAQPRPQASPSRPASPAPRPAARPTPPATTAEPEAAAPTAEADPTPEASTSSDSATLTPLSQYVLQFNRSPIVGNALQMEGVLSEARLGFTRPRHWQVESAKVQIRFRHSAALYAERSNLTVRLNNVHLGSLPLNRSADEIGNVLFEIPAESLQDYNTLVMQVQQHTSAECTDPTDPALWTEILPDSHIIMNYRPQAIALDLANYPYPFLNELGLDADQLAYLQPQQSDDMWLTAAARYQAAAARLTNFRSIQTRLVEDLESLTPGERLIVIGTPANQPLLSQLALPFALKNNQLLDGANNVLPNDVGVVMLTTTADGSSPVLVITGNDAKGVLKAAQALVQDSDRPLLTGQAALVSEVADVESPDDQAWSGYLPQAKRFQLTDLQNTQQQAFQDVTVNGLPIPPAVQIPFKALPDTQLLKGSTFTLHYSYGPNINPARSSVSVRLDGQGLGGERLRNVNGGSDSLTVNIPPDFVKPSSILEVQFLTYPKTAISCGDVPDQPMWGTVHGDSSFKLNRTSIVQLPNLKLLQTGYPLTAPQDMAQTAFVLPERPNRADLLTLLQTSSRLGRLSDAKAVKLEVYSATSLPESVRRNHHLIGIGSRDRFPLPVLFEQQTGFTLGQQFLRRQDRSQIQALPDNAGVIEAMISPWNSERILLGLTSQSDVGLAQIQQVFYRDSLFSQMAGDTLLVQQQAEQGAGLITDSFQVTTLSQNTPTTLDRRNPLRRAIALLQANWFLVPGGLVLIALLFYGVSQLYLNRLSHSEGA
ncbi:MAG: cellulose biosynthesis cyclic di-GMP-binding regulatory protein BcsB [Leptolyngbya sp. SIO4C5]|nr:cellulose biosynthesis cyclic di-GMP-binding regulatory protein BcsB [Leptolyngbya sp. SIO4C5]